MDQSFYSFNQIKYSKKSTVHLGMVLVVVRSLVEGATTIHQPPCNEQRCTNGHLC